jgi:hypothetical protein
LVESAQFRHGRSGDVIGWGNDVETPKSAAASAMGAPALVFVRQGSIYKAESLRVFCVMGLTPAQRIISMARTKFGAGQRVAVLRSGGFSAPSGVYRIVTALPLESGPQQYRVRNESESFDRVMDEVRLEALDHD